MGDGDAKKGATKGVGEFFLIDLRAWARVCALGLYPAICYLVLARGSARDNRTTAWSVNAIERYTGIGRPRAKKAIKDLEASRIIQRQGGPTTPRYVLTPAHEIPGCEGFPPPTITREEMLVVDHLSSGETWLPNRSTPEWGHLNPRTLAGALSRKGLVQDLGAGHFKAVVYDADAAARPDWIWLPNTIIDGASDETAPVELIRQSQSVVALRLFVDLYHAHNLASDGGIHFRHIWKSFDRHKVGERGAFTIWGFQSGEETARLSAPFVKPHLSGRNETIHREGGGTHTRDAGWSTFWDIWGTLTRLGLVEFVGHIVEADTEEAEPIHPYAINEGEKIERRLANAAHNAAEAMLTEGQRQWAREHGLALVPVRSHLAAVQMVGIARLRYRPRTKATAAWFARQREWEEWVGRYDEMAVAAQNTATDPDMQHQRRSMDIKE
jgi:hypothetical protein